MRARGWAAAALALGLGCGGPDDDADLVLIPNTTTRVGPVVPAGGTELRLQIFRTPDECQGAGIVGSFDEPGADEALARCLPHVDRRSGEVRLGIQFKRDTAPVALPLSEEHISVVHQGREVRDQAEADDRYPEQYTIIPHDPQQTGQLYVLLIDGSGSMSEIADARSGRTRMEEVRSALRMRDVQDAFFSDGKRNAVVLVQFTSGDPRPVGGSIQILENKGAYRDAVDELQVLGGFTWLYKSVAWAAGPLFDDPTVAELLDLRKPDVTIIALTDGFNNEAGADVCADNAPRLRTLVEQLDTMRKGGQGRRVSARVFTVGLGSPIRKEFELPRSWAREVDPRDLCGRDQDRRIDSDLELEGIDNASLEWIARAGGGEAYVRRSRKGLGEAFRASAAPRYNWFEVRYRLDPFLLRRAFTTRLWLRSFYTADASVRLYPSAWLDAPPGEVDADGWTLTQTYGHTMTVLTPVIGLLMLLGYLGAAWSNGRRSLSGRKRRRTPKG